MTDDRQRRQAGSAPLLVGRTFWDWLTETKFHEWATMLVALASLGVTLGYIQPRVDQVERDTANVLPELGVEQELSRGNEEIAGVSLVVQLASYFARNCATAQIEADSYRSKFELPPALFLTASADYVVVGIPATSAEEAELIRQQALELSKLPQYRKEDLANARIRKDPQWKMISNCGKLTR